MEKPDKEIEYLLRENNIKEIYFNSEITIDQIIKILNKENQLELNRVKKIEKLKNSFYQNNINYEEEQIEDKKIIENKKKEKSIMKNTILKCELFRNKLLNMKFKLNNRSEEKHIKNKMKDNGLIIKELILNKLKEKLLENNLSENSINKRGKIISVSGPPNVGKTNFVINFFKIINNKKILIIDFDLEKQNIFNFLGIKKYSKKLDILFKNNKNNFENSKNLDMIIKNNFKENNYKRIKHFIYYFLIKLDKNIFLLSGLDLFRDFFNNNDLKYINIIFDNVINEISKEYDLILFDIGSQNNKKINKIILKKSNLNIILVEGNLIGINKFKRYLELNELNKLNNIKIIINKKDKYCIDENILKEIFNFKIIGLIKYENIYSNLINKNFSLLNIKNKYKDNYKKIYYEIENMKK